MTFAPRTWWAPGSTPIGLQDARRTAATWLDHAGVSRNLTSGLVLDGEPDKARSLLDDLIATREAE
jgi:hypothetical protein